MKLNGLRFAFFQPEGFIATSTRFHSTHHVQLLSPGFGPPPPFSMQNEYALMKLNGWELVASQIFFYSFQIFMVFIIMQFLVAIAVDAFAEVKVRNRPLCLSDPFASYCGENLTRAKMGHEVYVRHACTRERDPRPGFLNQFGTCPG
jgi:hypothetical protein